MEAAYHNAPFTSPPNPSRDAPYWQKLFQPHTQGNNMPQYTTAEIADANTQIDNGIMTQQQQEIDHQLASRLQEVEIARVQNRPSQYPMTKELGSQYNPRDLQNINGQDSKTGNILLGKWNLFMWDPPARDSKLIEILEDHQLLQDNGTQ